MTIRPPTAAMRRLIAERHLAGDANDEIALALWRRFSVIINSAVIENAIKERRTRWRKRKAARIARARLRPAAAPPSDLMGSRRPTDSKDRGRGARARPLCARCRGRLSVTARLACAASFGGGVK